MSAEDDFLQGNFDKIKKMYFSDRIIDPMKKDKILNWFLNNFHIYQEKKSSKYKLLWLTFYDILVGEKQIVGGNRILMNRKTVEKFLYAVKNYPYSSSWASVILSSISVFLQTPSINSTMIDDMNLLLKFLIETLKLICELQLHMACDPKIIYEAECLAQLILDILENLPPKDIEKIPVLLKSLQDIASFMHMSTDENKLENISDKFAKKISSVVFNVESKKFETLLTPTTGPTTEQPYDSYILQFLLSIQSMLLSKEIDRYSIPINITAASLIKKLLLNFFLQNKKSFCSLKLLSLFCSVCGVDIPIVLGTTSCCNSLLAEKYKNSDISILGISYILEACCSVPQYFTSVSCPDGYVTPSMWLEALSFVLLHIKNSEMKVEWFKCFQSLLTILPSILDKNIVPLIKATILTSFVHSTESKRQFCELFSTILETHSQLHQIPKFFVKLLLALTENIKENSGGRFLSNGQILPQMDETIAKCVQELPYGQMIEVWKIFNETFTTLEIMSEAFEVNKSFMFFVAQLFTTILLHAQLFQANIPTYIESQITHLIEITSLEVKKNISTLKDVDVKALPLQRSVLLLSYAIGEVKLAYNAFYEKPLDNCESQAYDFAFDFSLLHNYLGKECAAIMESFLHGDDKILSILVFQLLLQKAKAIQFKESFTKPGNIVMEKLISIILEYLHKSSSAIESSDMDLSEVNEKNWGTVVWRLFLKVFPLVLSNFRHRDFHTLCEITQKIILQSPDDGAKSHILSALKNDFFQESKHFQTAFVSVLWKHDNLLICKKRLYSDIEFEQSTSERIFSLLNTYHSKALKYTERTPKSEKNLGSTWDEIKEICDLLSDILTSETLPKDKLVVENMYNAINLFNYLPLEYLLPGNQMKSIIGLSYLYFLIPQSCDLTESVCLLREISLKLVSIFGGVRSIWFFDFVNGGAYLKFVVQTLEKVIDVDDNECDWAAQLIEHLISHIVRKIKPLNSLQQYISTVTNKNKLSRTTLITFHALFKQLPKSLSLSHKQDFKDALSSISYTTFANFVKYMKLNFSRKLEVKIHNLFMKCFIQLIDILSCPESNIDACDKQDCLEFFSSIPDIAFKTIESLEDDAFIGVYFTFLSKVFKFSTEVSSFLTEENNPICWNIILCYLEKKANNKKNLDSADENSNNTIEKTEICCSDPLPCFLCFSKDYRLPFNIKNMEQDKKISSKTLVPLFLNESEEEYLQELVKITSSGKLSKIFKVLIKKMGASKSTPFSIQTFQIFFSAFRCILSTTKDKCQQPLWNKPLQKCLLYLNSLINQTCSSEMCQALICVPILDFICFVLKGIKILPKHIVFQSLHYVVPVPEGIFNYSYGLYVKLFNAALCIVYNMLIYHNDMVLASPAPFLTFVSKLLKSIIKAGAADPLSECDVNTFREMQSCAQTMKRLLIIISQHKREFSKLVPYLVADYVDTIQHFTLDSNIKDSILSGIHSLLDICSDESVKMLATNINYISREIYVNLIKDYRKNQCT